ncbi:hypothetical protein CHY_2527 [Carboxydothermus hydrogenoformans Z-2901]|uniref:Uncharacterized protein n=1 Tax=Carboxydothermus hydrogenoformans (strain ATCC BAA-161 / DSM 6008 / Z-2901) TaxID=246194 RepID=Q3A964_CARHZ|nr:hypothetical protein CHY_2527 [Carboxydothermus hydrogenoformans Z-2901]
MSTIFLYFCIRFPLSFISKKLFLSYLSKIKNPPSIHSWRVKKEKAPGVTRGFLVFKL